VECYLVLVKDSENVKKIILYIATFRCVAPY